LVTQTSYISGALPVFMLGCELTPVPELGIDEARELVRIILEDTAIRNEKQKWSKRGTSYVGKHIVYPHLPKRFRGSDKSERVYASVRIFMRVRLPESDACREVAKILGSKLGSSKRGRPAKNLHHARKRHEIVRSMYNSFARRNPWPPSQESATFTDSRAEFWFQYAAIIREWKKGRLVICPPGWKPSPTAQIQAPDGQEWAVPFPQETPPSPAALASVARKLAKGWRLSSKRAQ